MAGQYVPANRPRKIPIKASRGRVRWQIDQQYAIGKKHARAANLVIIQDVGPLLSLHT
jgi:hypothetical protein